MLDSEVTQRVSQLTLQGGAPGFEAQRVYYPKSGAVPVALDAIELRGFAEKAFLEEDFGKAYLEFIVRSDGSLGVRPSGRDITVDGSYLADGWVGMIIDGSAITIGPIRLTCLIKQVSVHG